MQIIATMRGNSTSTMAMTTTTTATTTIVCAWFVSDSDMRVTFKELYEAAQECRKGKAQGVGSQCYEADKLENLIITQQALHTYNWHPKPMRCFVAQNGAKPREIHAPDYADRVVHHCLVPKLRNLIEAKFIYDCAANIKGKGTHFAVNRVQKMIRQEQALHNKIYYLQLDIYNFFYSINHQILLSLLAKHLYKASYRRQIGIADARDLYRLCYRIITTPHTVLRQAKEVKNLPKHKQLSYALDGVGLPIGNLSSQFFSNVYMNELDQFIKHNLKARCYSRFVDDFVLIHHKPVQLQQWHQKIVLFLSERLQLTLKATIKLAPVNNGIDYLGYIIYPHYRLVRKRVLHHCRQKLQQWWQDNAIRTPKGWLLRKPNTEALQSLLASYWGHCQHANTYQTRQKLIKYFSWLRWLFYFSDNLDILPLWRLPKAKKITRFSFLHTYYPINFYQQQQWFHHQYQGLVSVLQKGRQGVIYPNKPIDIQALTVAL